GPDGAPFDDVQFFTPATIGRLLRSTGFRPSGLFYSGFIPPALARLGLCPLERSLPRIPVISRLGYFYLAVGTKMAD
ncbi:MAG: hypothetical protein ACM3JD_11970, partial [Rudaea sp.]